jgi:hypothetical protein
MTQVKVLDIIGFLAPTHFWREADTKEKRKFQVLDFGSLAPTNHQSNRPHHSLASSTMTMTSLIAHIILLPIQ